jgi:hypothetical protein
VSSLFSVAVAIVGCGSLNGGTKDTFQTGGSSSGSGNGSGSANGAGGANGPSAGAGLNGAGGGLLLDAGAGTGAGDGGHVQTCVDAGDCTCITVASIGHEGVWGPCSSDTTTAFQTWLNTQSTAKVDNYDTTKPTLTPAFLAKYDVIILQWMVANGQQYDDGAPWQFSAAEVSALEDWVKAGGGIISLSGYQCNGQGCTIYDTTATNQLLSFTDIQYNADDVLDPSQTSCQDCYCWGGSLPLGGPVAGTGIGTWDQSSPIGAHVTDVGAYSGRSIKSTTASVDCTDGTHDYSVHEQIGQGHVVAFTDEWITYSGEWLGTASCLQPGMFTDPNNPCYQRSAAQVFQIPQFWYNAIKYAASSVTCFTISSPGIIQ